MLEIFKTQEDKTLKALGLNDAESGSWFNMIDPSFEEIQKVSLVLDLDETLVHSSFLSILLLVRKANFDTELIV